jgi:hypothetical protein
LKNLPANKGERNLAQGRQPAKAQREKQAGEEIFIFTLI